MYMAIYVSAWYCGKHVNKKSEINNRRRNINKSIHVNIVKYLSNGETITLSAI